MGSFPGGSAPFFAVQKFLRIRLSDDVFFYNIRILQSLSRRKLLIQQKDFLKKRLNEAE